MISSQCYALWTSPAALEIDQEILCTDADRMFTMNQQLACKNSDNTAHLLQKGYWQLLSPDIQALVYVYTFPGACLMEESILQRHFYLPTAYYLNDSRLESLATYMEPYMSALQFADKFVQNVKKYIEKLLDINEPIQIIAPPCFMYPMQDDRLKAYSSNPSSLTLNEVKERFMAWSNALSSFLFRLYLWLNALMELQVMSSPFLHTLMAYPCIQRVCFKQRAAQVMKSFLEDTNAITQYAENRNANIAVERKRVSECEAHIRKSLNCLLKKNILTLRDTAKSINGLVTTEDVAQVFQSLDWSVQQDEIFRDLLTTVLDGKDAFSLYRTALHNMPFLDNTDISSIHLPAECAECIGDVGQSFLMSIREIHALLGTAVDTFRAKEQEEEKYYAHLNELYKYDLKALLDGWLCPTLMSRLYSEFEQCLKSITLHYGSVPLAP